MDNKVVLAKKGFTLLELLIVISIIAILSVALVIVINPAETLKKSRDTQRISDLSALKTALGIYTTSVSPVYLAGVASNAACQATSGTWDTATSKIYYSQAKAPAPGETISDLSVAGVTFSTGFGPSQDTTVAAAALVDGTGWLPVKFSGITGGSPISNLPLDPTNTIASGTPIANCSTGCNTAVASTAAATVGKLNANMLVYRYACSSSGQYEIDATLESSAYGVNGTDDKSFKDGGNSGLVYEIGTDLGIFGANGVTDGDAAGF